MYKNAESCIKNCSNLGYFPCSPGGQQGKNLSPFLFALYLLVSDLEAYSKSRYNGLPTLRDVLSEAEDHLNTNLYENMFTLLYADDAVLFAETKQVLQTALNGLNLYCKRKKLVTNTTKTEVLVFPRGKIINKLVLYLNGESLQTFDDYVYLGITFNPHNTDIFYRLIIPCGVRLDPRPRFTICTY